MAATNTENAPQSFNSMLMVKQIILLVAMAGSVTAGWWMFDWLKEPNYGVLFTSLDNQEASLIMDELQQQNTRYKVDNSTGAILVPSADVHKIRIKLAAQGLPKGTSGGILGGEEGASGFGVSEAMEKARFQKALEAELAVTITSITNVKSARVHLAIPKQSVFVRDRQKPRASIAINLYAGRQLADWQVAAIVHLVSSGVSNLETDDVTIIDQKGRLLTSGQSNSEMAMTSTQFQYTQRLEKSYARRIENILTPILGADSVRAQVTANIDFTYSEQTQETFNPDTPTVRSSQTVDEQSNGKGSGGVPGALTNQPPGQSDVPETASSNEAGSAAGKNSRSTRRETKNFELDKTISHTRFAMGRLRRLSTAVVLDDVLTTDEAGVVVRTERSPEELERITSLVKKAIGFDMQRGDSVKVINAAFTQPEVVAEMPATPIWEEPWVWDVVKHVIGVILIIVLGFGVLRPVFRAITSTMQPIMNAPPQLPAAMATADMAEDQLSLTAAENKQLEAPPRPVDKELQIAHQTVNDDPKLVAQVVKNWVNDNG